MFYKLNMKFERKKSKEDVQLNGIQNIAYYK